jgi:hypothetical protein
MMRGLRFLGGRAGGGKLTLAVAVLAVLMLAGGKGATFQDLLTVILIALSLLTAGVLAFFVIQVRMARKEAVHPVRARARPTARSTARSTARPTRAARPLPANQAGLPGPQMPKLSDANAMPR